MATKIFNLIRPAYNKNSGSIIYYHAIKPNYIDHAFKGYEIRNEVISNSDLGAVYVCLI